MDRTQREHNRVFVLEAFDLLFNKRDYAEAEGYWSASYIQHSAHIEPGREGLFALVSTLPPTLRHETDAAMAEGDLVMIRGRFSGHGEPSPWIACDLVRIEDGLLQEHRDIIEPEVGRSASVSGLPMYGADFPEDRI